MNKILTSLSLSLLISLPVMANDLSKPPTFKPSAETIERSQQAEKRAEMAKKQAEAKKAKEDKAVLNFPNGHDPRDHDHDHDDPADLDHEHDDPRAHEKQLETLEDQSEDNGSSWWPF